MAWSRSDGSGGRSNVRLCASERAGGGGGAGGFLAGCQLPAALQHVNMSVARETRIASTATRRTETAAVVSFRIFKRSESIQALGGGWAAAARIPIQTPSSRAARKGRPRRRWQVIMARAGTRAIRKTQTQDQMLAADVSKQPAEIKKNQIRSVQKVEAAGATLLPLLSVLERIRRSCKGHGNAAFASQSFQQARIQTQVPGGGVASAAPTGLQPVCSTPPLPPWLVATQLG